jgi:hypothetical protein
VKQHTAAFVGIDDTLSLVAPDNMPLLDMASETGKFVHKISIAIVRLKRADDLARWPEGLDGLVTLTLPRDCWTLGTWINSRHAILSSNEDGVVRVI